MTSMPISTAPLTIAVILGSARAGRLGEGVFDWFVDELGGRPDVRLDLIDVREIGLGSDSPAVSPLLQQYDDTTAAYAARIDAADAYIVVVPEYNHGYPAALKNAIDAVYKEWMAKPVAFVSYGGASGGTRAVEQLRQVFIELHAVPIREQVALPNFWEHIETDGRLRPGSALIGDPKRLVDSLSWWARTLRAGRATSPYAA